MMSPVEEFILKHVFEWEDHPDVVGNICFFAGEYTASYIGIDDKEGLRKLIAESRALSPELCGGIERALVVDDGSIEIDQIGGYEPIFQAIVKRNKAELPFVSIEQAFTCTKMHPDAFGGAGILIGPDSIESMNTTTWLEGKIANLKSSDGSQR
jgi:hypothetical protein